MCLSVCSPEPENLDMKTGISLAEGLVFLPVVFKSDSRNTFKSFVSSADQSEDGAEVEECDDMW